MANNPFYVDPGNDLSAGLSGLSGTLANVRQGRIVESELKRKADAEAAQQQRQADAVTASQQAFQTGNPEEMARVSLQFPEIRDGLMSSYGLVNEVKAKEAGDFAKTLLMARPEDRSSIYEQRITSLQEQGRDPSHTMQSYQDYQRNPNGELQALETTWAGIAPKEYMVIAGQHKADQKAALEQQKMAAEESRFQRQEAGRNARASRNAMPGTNGKPTAGMQDFQYYQQLKKDDPSSAEAFGMERGFISKEGQELSGHLQKRLSAATDDAIAAERNVGKFSGLADEIDRSDLSGGVFGGKWTEKVKDLTGEQDAISNLRREYNAIKGSQVVSNLPPGAASDKDIELALGGFPTDNASKEQLSGFLRGLSKIQQYNADFNNFKAEYISDTGNERGMLKAWKDSGAAPIAPADSQSGAWEIVN